VIADHARAVTSAISDGAMPSNEGRGYVLRRLIRRASRFGRQSLALEQPFLCEVVPAVAEVPRRDVPRDAPALRSRAGRRARRGGAVRAHARARARLLRGRRIRRGEETIAGEKAYDLYSTYGFPQDLVELMARERGLAVDLEGWRKAEAEHQKKSRSEGQLQADPLRGAAREPAEDGVDLPRVRRALDGARDARRRRVRRPDRARSRARSTPSPAARSATRGTIEALDGSFSIAVEDAKKIGDLVVHSGQGAWRAEARRRRRARRSTANAATAPGRTTRRRTSCHKALKIVLGGARDRSRGATSAPTACASTSPTARRCTAEELERIETLVNETRLRERARADDGRGPRSRERAAGVVAMFGEKYEDRVRVLDVGGWSLELCGGTHVAAAGDIGPS
jgi:alanyl-tRNA synthetase